MPTSRTFQLDVDTKRYINRVNSYRLLNGLGNLLPPDVADIDNFVVGLKDLGVWNSSFFYLFGRRYNVGVGNLSVGIGGYSSDLNIVGTPIWTTESVQLTNTAHYMVGNVYVNTFNTSFNRVGIFKADVAIQNAQYIVLDISGGGMTVDDAAMSSTISGGKYNLTRGIRRNSSTGDFTGGFSSSYFITLGVPFFVGSSMVYTPTAVTNNYGLDNSAFVSRTVFPPSDGFKVFIKNCRVFFNVTPQLTQGNQAYYYAAGYVFSGICNNTTLYSIYTLMKNTISKYQAAFI